MDKILFFSDAHLSPSLPKRIKALMDFFSSGEFKSAKEVYILGDLFDFWIGPKHIELIDYQDILTSLKQRTKKGQKIYFIYGNRDFLVDKAFTKSTGVKLLGDSVDLTLGGKKVHLTHGDLLCTRDKGYRSYRRLIRTKLIKSATKSIPKKAGLGIGKSLRDLSTNLVKKKPDPERTIAPEAVARTFKRGYDVIIAGHVHKKSYQEFDKKRLYTLGSFSQGGHYIIYKDEEFQAKQF